MSVQCPDLGVIVYLGMLAHYALPDKRPRRVQDLTPVLKDRFWPKIRLRERLLSTPDSPPDQPDLVTEPFPLPAKFLQGHEGL